MFKKWDLVISISRWTQVSFDVFFCVQLTSQMSKEEGICIITLSYEISIIHFETRFYFCT